MIVDDIIWSCRYFHKKYLSHSFIARFRAQFITFCKTVDVQSPEWCGSGSGDDTTAAVLCSYLYVVGNEDAVFGLANHTSIFATA